MKTKPVVARYRRLAERPFRSRAISLQEAVSEAMHHAVDGVKIRDDYRLREADGLGQSTDTFVLAYPHITDEFFFCELARFEKGANIPLCWGSRENPGALIIGQQEPGAGREALLGVLQFMVVGNHIALIESAGVRTGRLEEYLTWLLKDRVGAIPTGTHLTFETEFEITATGDDKGISDVKEIALVPIPLKQTEGHRTPAEIVARRDAHDLTRPEVAREILAIMGNTEADIDRLLGEVPPGGDVELRLSLFFKKGRGKGATTPTVASARQLFRHMEDEAIALKSSDGKVVGNMAVLARDARVKMNGSIMDYQDAARVLWEAYEYWIASGKIEHAI